MPSLRSICASGLVGSQGVLLGDRIAPQTTELRADGVVVVSYADRAPGESFATPPSVGKSIWLKLDPATLQFGEVVQDFEGEADPRCDDARHENLDLGPRPLQRRAARSCRGKRTRSP